MIYIGHAASIRIELASILFYISLQQDDHSDMIIKKNHNDIVRFK